VRDLSLIIDGDPPLAGTLTLPDRDRPVPAVVIASGSGPLDRDSNHRRARFDVARQLAVALAEAGLASLRYDKRGVGESPGDWRAAGLHDNVDDLGRALATLAARPEVDADPSCWPATARARSCRRGWPPAAPRSRASSCCR
jgi:alpha/beta superfamily hydrolase